MKKILIIISGIFIPLFGLMAQSSDVTSSYVSTAVPFLTITPDSRAAGMGEVGVATSADVNSIHWNASKYVFIDKKMGLSGSYTPWLKDVAEGINLAYFSGYYKFANNQSISASFRYFSLGEIDKIDKSGRSLSKASPNEYALDFAYSRKLSESFSMAVAFRYIQSNIIEGDNANSIAADVSCFYTKALKDANIAFGANISNIGSKVTYSNADYYLPTNLKLGTSYTRFFDEDSKLSLSVDVNKLLVDGGDKSGFIKNGVISLGGGSNKDVISSMISSLSDFSAITYSIGTEYSYDDILFLRLGYFYESADAGNRNYMTTGLGINYSNIAFDLAYLISTDSTNPLKNTIRFTIGYNL